MTAAVPAFSSQSNSVLRVVLFSGGRGSSVLTRPLVRDPRIQLTVAINGYDDGASTGEVRRFLGDALGPSDFRKNASRLAAEMGTCPLSVVEALDGRLPADVARDAAIATLRRAAESLPPIRAAVDAFVRELDGSSRPFDFRDCAVGNVVFAGVFLEQGRDFNRAVDAYSALLGLPAGLIDNVTDGSNAFLVATDCDGAVLGSEAEIVDANHRNRIRDIYLIDRPFSQADRARLAVAGPSEATAFFESRRAPIGLNPRLGPKLASADLIIYAPGTQHSSLFPSYLTPGLSGAIAANLGAIKLLITNLRTDAEITGSSAVDLIDRAVYYLKEKGTLRTPVPCLITHYVLNDPGRAETAAPYVPLGQVDTIEDPRLVRIANYEEGVTGRHDASKILGPFLQSLLKPRRTPKLGVLFHDAGSPDKVTQSILEMVRGGIHDVPVDVTVFYEGEPLDPLFVASLPVAVRALSADVDRRFRDALRDEGFEYVLLFESSGMYRGEDLVYVASHLTLGRLDAAWGSRRLSVRDIETTLRMRYQKNRVAQLISAGGSHLLSLACLVLYGRYISDTLSAVRAIRAGDVLGVSVPVTHKRVNQHLLARLLRRKAEILEIPVQFFPLSPERVKRTSVLEGLQSLGALVLGRLRTPGSLGAPDERARAQAVGSEERRSDPVVSR